MRGERLVTENELGGSYLRFGENLNQILYLVGEEKGVEKQGG